MSELSQLSVDVVEMRETMEILIAGLKQVSGGIENQTTMLREILDAVSAEPPTDSPLIRLLQELVAIGERNEQLLQRIDGRLSRQRFDA
jgi:hypothetical protein